MELNQIKNTWRNFRNDRSFIFLNVMSLFTGLLYLCLVYFSISDARKGNAVNKNDVKAYRIMGVPLVDGIETMKDDGITSTVKIY